MVAIGEDVRLEWQEGAAAVDEIDAGEPVFEGDFLGAEMLLDRHRVIRAALDGRVVGDDDAGRPLDPPNAGDDPGTRGILVVQPVGGQWAELQERRAGIEQALDALTNRQLSPLAVARDRPPIPSGASPGHRVLSRPQVGYQRLHRRAVARAVGPRLIEP